jgi:hypothetical protein
MDIRSSPMGCTLYHLRISFAGALPYVILIHVILNTQRKHHTLVESFFSLSVANRLCSYFDPSGCAFIRYSCRPLREKKNPFRVRVRGPCGDDPSGSFTTKKGSMPRVPSQLPCYQSPSIPLRCHLKILCVPRKQPRICNASTR